MSRRCASSDDVIDFQLVVERLQAAITGAGSRKALAREWGISECTISQVLNQIRLPSAAFLKRLGLGRCFVCCIYVEGAS